ncbi:MAG: fasciclin domain-containing protein [Bacteroidota bacterium]
MKNAISIFILFASALVFSSCEFMGLGLQEDYEYTPRTLDPHINMTVMEFLQSSPGHQLDSLLSAIQYAGLTDEFSKPGRTFFFLHNLAIYRLDSKGKVDVNCYFGKYTVNGKPATKWKDYPVEQVRNLLLYHMVEGEYTYDNLTPDNIELITLSTAAKNKMLLRIVNDRDSKVTINEFFGSIKVVRARTSNLLATDGTIHIVGDFAEYGP